MSLTRENLTDDQRDVMRKITRADEEAREAFFTAVEKIRRDSGMEEAMARDVILLATHDHDLADAYIDWCAD